MKKIVLVLLLSMKSFSQIKNFIDFPYIETSAKIDTLVIPDRIYLNILISEKDTKGKISVEELENKMMKKLELIGIIVEKQLTLNNLSSDFKNYFLKKNDIQKSKNYTLVVHSANVAGNVIVSLEEIDISNISLEKTEYSNTDPLILNLKSKAILKAKNQAIAMTKPLNQKTGNAIYISDYTDFPSIMANSQVRFRKNNLEENDSFEPINIDFQKIKIEIEVKVTFKLE